MTCWLEQLKFCCIPVMYLNQQGLDVTPEDLAILVSDKQIRIIHPYVYIKEKEMWEATGTMESSPLSCTSCLLSCQNQTRKTYNGVGTVMFLTRKIHIFHELNSIKWQVSRFTKLRDKRFIIRVVNFCVFFAIFHKRGGHDQHVSAIIPRRWWNLQYYSGIVLL